MTRYRVAGTLILVVVTAESSSNAQELGAIGGHTEFGVLPVSGESLSVVFGLGLDVALAHVDRWYLGAGPSGLIAVQTSQTGCGSHCPRGLGALGANVEGGATFGSWFLGARVAPLVGYSNGYPGHEVAVWLHPSLVVGWTSAQLAIGAYCGYLAAVQGGPSGFDPGLQFTSFF
ncbi:MAG TPA: hypothetical protein VEK07_15505 [Polyangiaceae bacterium]|nr:hypothetical protein [Polyangiaceae bacterium]